MAAAVRIYTTRWCGYCVAALRLLDKKRVRYENIDVGSDPDKRRWLLEVTGRHTVPQVFIDDRPVGGYTDLADLDRRGALDRLLHGGQDPGSQPGKNTPVSGGTAKN